MNEKKYRHELKFILSPEMALILKYRLSLIMEVDKNSVNEDNTYLIRSLYFDDLKSSAYIDKVDGIEKRVKYRIRVYNLDDSFIRLEIKEKNRDLCHKTQTVISKSVCEQLIKGKADLKLAEGDEVLTKFMTTMLTEHLMPSVIVDYHRLAYTYPVEDVRITFDENIKSGRFNYDLFSQDILMYDTMDSKESVLEVKFNNHIPTHIVSVINSIPIIRQAVSKYAICYEKKEV